MQPGFPYEVGIMYNGGYQNGLLVYTQPNGPGTPVFPQPQQTFPPPNWKRTFYKPTYPAAYTALLAWPCGHWINEPEIFQVWDPYTEVQAALLCCSVCSYIGYIIEPAEEWWQAYFQIYPLGITQKGGGLIPNDAG